jgi:hypothetical protein
VVQASVAQAVVVVEPLVLTLWWAGSPLLLLTMVLLLMLVSGAVVVHHPVLQRSTTGWSYHNLPLLGLLVGTERVIRDDNVADKL